MSFPFRSIYLPEKKLYAYGLVEETLLHNPAVHLSFHMEESTARASCIKRAKILANKLCDRKYWRYFESL